LGPLTREGKLTRATKAPEQQGKARRGEARQGKARRGEARRGEARRGEARRGEARRGEARRGEARRGEATNKARRSEATKKSRGPTEQQAKPPEKQIQPPDIPKCKQFRIWEGQRDDFSLHDPLFNIGWRAEWYIVLRRNVAERLTLGVAVFKQEEATLIKNGVFRLGGGLGRKSPSKKRTKL
jgi:hypothetical protein